MRHENLSSQKKGVALVFGQNAGKASGMFFFSLEICIFSLNSYRFSTVFHELPSVSFLFLDREDRYFHVLK